MIDLGGFASDLWSKTGIANLTPDKAASDIAGGVQQLINNATKPAVVQPAGAPSIPAVLRLPPINGTLKDYFSNPVVLVGGAILLFVIFRKKGRR